MTMDWGPISVTDAKLFATACAFETFLLDRLAEDEAVAIKAPGPAWGRGYRRTKTEDGSFHVQGYVLWTPIMSPVDENESVGHLDIAETVDSTPESLAAVDHAVAWDPRRALDEVRVKRLILKRHARLKLTRGLMCHQCWESEKQQPWPCNTLRFVALPYAWHDDYDEAWRPTIWEDR